jgi:hypothetical protein
MKLELGDAQRGLEWLTDPNWIIFNWNDPKLSAFIENTCFKPGTPKNAEYQVAMIPLVVDGETKITFWERFLDTLENRKYFAKAMEFYHAEPLPYNWEDTIAEIREALRLELQVKEKRLVYSNRLGVVE